MQKVTIRIGNIEGVSCNADLTNEGEHTTMKIGLRVGKELITMGHHVDGFFEVHGCMPTMENAKAYSKVLELCTILMEGNDGK